jgi:hypothetical protein
MPVKKPQDTWRGTSPLQVPQWGLPLPYRREIFRNLPEASWRPTPTVLGKLLLTKPQSEAPLLGGRGIMLGARGNAATTVTPRPNMRGIHLAGMASS